MPDSFAETPNGLLMVANGFDPMLRWDGAATSMEAAGVDPPSTAPTVGGSGSGSIVGTYEAFLRFVDKYNNFSNLSPVSASYTAQGSSGIVTGASNATPIVITSLGHGLSTGATVKVTGVGGNTSANNTWTITVIDSNSFSLDGSTGTAAYTNGGSWTSGVSTITYAGVQAPSDPKIVRRQILRNTDGEASTFYVDIDSTNLGVTSFSSTLTDSQLSAQTAVPLFDTAGKDIANLYGVPPNWKSVLAHHRDRMWAAVDREYSDGNVQVALGSATVTGIGTNFTASMAGRFLYVTKANQSYQIASVDTIAQTLTLDSPYADSTDKFGIYAIRPAPAERRLVYYSESGLPEAWPITNAAEVQDDNDEITGLMQKSSFIYILERRHIHRVTYLTDPAVDGSIFPVANRGCINNRCWLVVDDKAYLLDEEGVYGFTCGENYEPMSNQIADIFNPWQEVKRLQVNWGARDLFHAVLFQPTQTMRWFVSMEGEWTPRHAICFNYRDRRWWVEEFDQPICSSCVGEIRRNPQVFLGSHHRHVLAYGIGSLDGADPTKGPVRGTATAATFLTITDSSATFDTGIVNSTVGICEGRGKNQVRRIVSVSGGTIHIDTPWRIKPDSTSVYQIGAIPWTYKSGWFRYAKIETDAVRRVEVVFLPLTNPATMDMRLYIDWRDNPVNWAVDQSSSAGAGVAVGKNLPDQVIDLTKPSGQVQMRMDGHKELYIDGPTFSQIQLYGMGSQEITRIYEITYSGVEGDQ